MTVWEPDIPESSLVFSIVLVLGTRRETQTSQLHIRSHLQGENLHPGPPSGPQSSAEVSPDWTELVGGGSGENDGDIKTSWRGGGANCQRYLAQEQVNHKLRKKLLTDIQCCKLLWRLGFSVLRCKMSLNKSNQIIFRLQTLQTQVLLSEGLKKSNNRD